MQDIHFNTSYGDVSFTRGDLHTAKDDEIYIQRIIQVIKTNYLDYELSPLYGADIDRFIGRGITRDLAIEIQESLLIDIKNENIPYDIRIPFIIKPYSIHFRIIIPGIRTLDLTFTKDKGFKAE